MEECFSQYTQNERESLKRIIRRIYFDRKDIISKGPEKHRNIELCNIFFQNVTKPGFYQDDIATLKDLFLYAEWVINHWKSIEKFVSTEKFKLEYVEPASKAKIAELQKRIEKLMKSEIEVEKIPAPYRKIYESGKTPDKIKLERLTTKNIESALKYVKAIEGVM